MTYLQISGQTDLLQRWGQALSHQFHHFGIDFSLGQTSLLQKNAQGLLEGLAPAEGQLQGFLAVEVAGGNSGSFGASLGNALVTPEVVQGSRGPDVSIRVDGGSLTPTADTVGGHSKVGHKTVHHSLCLREQVATLQQQSRALVGRGGRVHGLVQQGVMLGACGQQLHTVRQLLQELQRLLLESRLRGLGEEVFEVLRRESEHLPQFLQQGGHLVPVGVRRLLQVNLVRLGDRQAKHSLEINPGVRTTHVSMA
mmetsp:Transcript_35319/g.60798  ORF Transcript_35319/g.60798 Transcript_35319/m.60798 type:complete len:253 (-) Transcript_35319:670-1428(-)